MFVKARARKGIPIVLLITLRTYSPNAPPSHTVAIETTSETPMRIRKQRTITPNALQPYPLTSSRLRPNASMTGFRSRTITGISTLQIVSR
jgi:hypothetical protein